MKDARLVAVAAATGAGVMVLELMGVRLAAPWFGQSQLVWTNVIGVVLASLAAGQWLGGRWAESSGGPGPVALLITGGAYALALPRLVTTVSPWVLPDGLPLLEAAPFVTLGSLLVSLLGFGLPMVALGAVTPWLVRLSREAGAHPGEVAGRLLGAGTLGSLVGTFGATHLLLPWIGSAGAVRAGGVLLLLAAWGLRGAATHSRGRALLWMVLPLVSAFLPGPTPSAGLLAEVETPYQWARVVDRPDGSRALLLNEGLDSYHSLWPAEGALTGAYYDAFLGPALTAPPGDDGVRRVGIVGLAAGTMARQLLSFDPDVSVWGVEIDQEIVELGRVWFGLPDQVDVAAGVDGRLALSLSRERFSALLVDAFSEQIYLPPHLATRECFETMRERLVPGGIVAINVGGLSVEDPVVGTVAHTFAQVFPGARVGRVPGTRNMLLLGRAGHEPPADEVAERLSRLGLTEVAGWLADPSRMAPVPPFAVEPLRDGFAPVEALAHASWRHASLAPVSQGWSRLGEASEALAAARGAIGRTAFTEASFYLDQAARSSDADLLAQVALLRGNIAWERGDPEQALGRYDEAPPLADSPVSQALSRNRDAARLAVTADREREAWLLRLAASLGALVTLVLTGLGVVARRSGSP